MVMEVQYDMLVPTKGKEIAVQDRDGTYCLEIRELFQQGHNLDGKGCFFLRTLAHEWERRKMTKTKV